MLQNVTSYCQINYICVTKQRGADWSLHLKFNNNKMTIVMNTYKVKAIRAIKRLVAIAKKQTQRKSSQITQNLKSTQPHINQLYSIDFVQSGTLHKNVVGRYAGLSKAASL